MPPPLTEDHCRSPLTDQEIQRPAGQRKHLVFKLLFRIIVTDFSHLRYWKLTKFNFRTCIFLASRYFTVWQALSVEYTPLFTR